MKNLHNLSKPGKGTVFCPNLLKWFYEKLFFLWIYFLADGWGLKNFLPSEILHWHVFSPKLKILLKIFFLADGLCLNDFYTKWGSTSMSFFSKVEYLVVNILFGRWLIFELLLWIYLFYVGVIFLFLWIYFLADGLCWRCLQIPHTLLCLKSLLRTTLDIEIPGKSKFSPSAGVH